MKSQAHAPRGPLDFFHIDLHAHPDLWKGLLAVLVGGGIALLPVPAGLKPDDSAYGCAASANVQWATRAGGNGVSI